MSILIHTCSAFHHGSGIVLKWTLTTTPRLQKQRLKDRKIEHISTNATTKVVRGASEWGDLRGPCILAEILFCSCLPGKQKTAFDYLLVNAAYVMRVFKHVSFCFRLAMRLHHYTFCCRFEVVVFTCRCVVTSGSLLEECTSHLFNLQA